MSSVEKILPVVMGGGSSDQMLPLIAGMMSKEKEGFGGGMGLIVILLLAFLFLGGKNGVGTSAAAGCSTCPEYLQLLNSINQIGTAVAASTGNINQGVDSAAARVIASSDTKFDYTNANIAETKASICRVGEMVGAESRATERSLSNGFAATLAALSNSSADLQKSLSCGFQTQTMQNSTAFNNLGTMMSNYANTASAQASQNFCNLSSQVKDVACAVHNGNEKILSSNEINTQKILDKIDDAQKNAIIMQKDAQIAELLSKQREKDLEIMLTNKLATLISCNGNNGNNGNSLSTK